MPRRSLRLLAPLTLALLACTPDPASSKGEDAPAKADSGATKAGSGEAEAKPA